VGRHKSHYVNQIYYHQSRQTAICYLSNYETILKRFHEHHNFPIYTEVWNGQQYQMLYIDKNIPVRKL